MAFADTAVRSIQSCSLATPVTLAGTVFKGDAIGITAGTWVRADGNSSPAITGLLVAAEDGISGQIITAYPEAVIDGPTGATPGAPIFLSDTAGRYTETPSTTTAQLVGFAVSATRIAITQMAIRGEFVVRHNFAHKAAPWDIIFIAPRPCYVRKISCVYGTGSGAAGTLTVERLQGTEAVTAGDDLCPVTPIDENTTVDTVQNAVLTTTAAHLLLAVGDRLAVKEASGTGTTLANCCVTVQLEWA
jgi:hypothetical protein